MRFTQRALILVAALAATGTAWAQEPSTPTEITPAPLAAQPAEPAPDVQAVPVSPNTEVVPVPAPEIAPIPQTAAPAPAPAPESLSTAPAQQGSKMKIAPAAPNKTARVRKPREIKPAEPTQDQQDQKAASAAAAGTAAASATSDAGQVPPSSPGPDATSGESAVAPAPVAEQRPVVAPAAVETRPSSSHASLWLLLGGLVLGAGGIVSMLVRRGRDDSISIVDHGVPTISSRPPIVAHRRSSSSESLS